MKRWPVILFICWISSLHGGNDKDTLTICADYHCELQKEVILTESEWQQVMQPFAVTATDAQQERQQISQSIALFEQVIGQYAGTHADLAENEGEDKAGQLDCISESRNTSHYLEWLEKKNKLKWHQVKQRASRSPILVDIHWTAVIQDKQSGVHYAVDSWFYKNGEPPVIQSINQWLKKIPVRNAIIR